MPSGHWRFSPRFSTAPKRWSSNLLPGRVSATHASGPEAMPLPTHAAHVRRRAAAFGAGERRPHRRKFSIRFWEEAMRLVSAVVLGLVSIPALAAAEEPLVLRGMGSFHVGGRIVEITGKPVREIVRQPGGPLTKLDPNGQYMVEQMYVQYFLPQNRKGKLPLLMWHGGGLTGVTYESTPDGREGWLNMFVRKGWDTYVSDAVERGRAGFAPPDVWASEPTFLTFQDPFERFRIGEGAGSWNADPAKRKVLPGSQFPVEAYDNYMKQQVP